MARSDLCPHNTVLRVAAVLVPLACFAVTPAALAADMEARVDTAYPAPQPPYPDPAQVNGEQGNVVLSVRVSASGKIINVRVDQSSGFADLDNAAVEGVLRWRFIPAVEDGVVISSWTKVKIVYRLPTAIIVPPRDYPPTGAGH